MSELISQLEWRLNQLKRIQLSPKQAMRIEARIKELRNEIALTISEDPEAA